MPGWKHVAIALFVVVLMQAVMMTACILVVVTHVGRIEGGLARTGLLFRSGDSVTIWNGPFQGRKGLILRSPAVGVQLLDSAGLAEHGGYLPMDPYDLSLDVTPLPPGGK